METPKLPGVEPDKPVEPAKPQADIDEIARHIGSHAATVEYVDRTSDAARDQGWGPVERPQPSTVSSTETESTGSEKAESKGRHLSAPTTRRPFELPNRIKSNGPRPLTPDEVQAGMTDEEIDRQAQINRTGAAAAKAALEAARNQKKL